MADPVDQYLACYAEAETGLCGSITQEYAHVLVVPARRESASLVDGIVAACSAQAGRVLVVVVVNAARFDDAAIAEGGALVETLIAGASRVERVWESPLAWFGERREFDLIVIDRARGSGAFSRRQGVGLARKIGADVALGLHRHGVLRSELIHFTDADATLPTDYFNATLAHDGAALCYPFWHAGRGDPDVVEATAIYELGVLHFVLGLRRAGSPYAYPSLGSSLAVRARSYAQVRGVPRVRAGEDFHLLAKLSKCGAVEFARTGTVVLESRVSSRVPFGTGPAVARAQADGRAPELYDPRVFDVLGAWLRHLDRVAAGAAPGFHPADMADAGVACEVASWLDEQGFPRAVEQARAGSRASAGRRRRLHEWFDALRTVQLIRLVTTTRFPKLPWREALTKDPHLTLPHGAELRVARHTLQRVVWMEAAPAGLDATLARAGA